MAVAGVDNTIANHDTIIFIIKKTKLYTKNKNATKKYKNFLTLKIAQNQANLRENVL